MHVERLESPLGTSAVPSVSSMDTRRRESRAGKLCQLLRPVREIDQRADALVWVLCGQDDDRPVPLTAAAHIVDVDTDQGQSRSISIEDHPRRVFRQRCKQRRIKSSKLFEQLWPVYPLAQEAEPSFCAEALTQSLQRLALRSIANQTELNPRSSAPGRMDQLNRSRNAFALLESAAIDKS
jgi:hypothetical protein